MRSRYVAKYIAVNLGLFPCYVCVRTTHHQQVKAAEAEAESKYLSGVGVSRQRKAIVDGLRDSVQDFSTTIDGKLSCKHCDGTFQHSFVVVPVIPYTICLSGEPMYESLLCED